MMYMATILIIGLLQLIYRWGSLKTMFFILKPVARLIELIYGSAFHYYEGVGFVSEELRINIGRECTGINFLSIAIMMLNCSFLDRKGTKSTKWVTGMGFLLISYGLTIWVNASRIIGTLLMMDSRTFRVLFEGRYQVFFHQSIGVVFYSLYLIITYVLCDEVLFRKEKNKNEKPR